MARRIRRGFVVGVQPGYDAVVALGDEVAVDVRPGR